MKRPASASDASSSKKPAVAASYRCHERTFDAAERAKFDRAVCVARALPDVPAWVQGPRPSDECLALHHHGDPHDGTVHLYSDAENEKRRRHPYPFDLIY